MYRGKLQQSYSNPNLKILLLEHPGIVTDHLQKLTLMIRKRIPHKVTTHFKDKFENLLKKSKFFGVLQSIPRSLKDQSSGILRSWAHQCECVVAHRLRRGQQMFCLYSKLWGEHALQEFITQMRNRVLLRGKDLVYGAIGITAYDWKTNRISDAEIKGHLGELDYIRLLRDKTLNKEDKNCQEQCNGSSLFDENNSNSHNPNRIITFDEWKVFIEKKDLIVWRRLHKSGHYEYKVYGSYNDVSAEDFLNVQVDTAYRRKWDSTAVVLEVVETDPVKSANSDIVYWEMLWPRLFANRDYVFNRRYFVDHKSKTVLLISKGTEHPLCPRMETKHRVRDYWSYMVIKPHSDLNKAGIEFSLTYFDNPGVNIPASVTAWVAMRAMPDFLERLRDATRKYKVYCQQAGVQCICDMEVKPEYLPRIENVSDSGWDDFYDDITDNTIFEAHPKLDFASFDYRKFFIKKRSKTPPPQSFDENDNANDTESSYSPHPSVPPTPQPKSSSYWRYLHPYYYFS